jgi:hypothetical protein
MCRIRSLSAALLAASIAAGCSGDDDGGAGGGGEADARPEDGDGSTPGADAAACVPVDDAAAVTIGTAASDDDHALVLPARSASATSWEELDNEALVLDVSGSETGVIGQLVLHQGQTAFS